jgi:ABC-2 type transport system ATP-binding protein
MQENIISVANLSRKFKTHKRTETTKAAIRALFKRDIIEHWALKDVSFNIKKGEIVGLIGPNGAGKSTCIKIMCGILYPTAGDVNIMGYVPHKDRVKYVKNIGVLFGHKTSLWWDLPANDTFYFFRDLYDVDKKKFEKKKNLMVKLLNVEQVIYKPVRDLSLGERMKCSVILAMLHDPKLVFLDEPTIGMDIIAKDTLRKFIKAVNEKYNTTFIITTHDMGDIEKLCKRVLIINHGKIVYDGLLAALKKNYIKTKQIKIQFDEKTTGVRLPRGCNVLHRSKFEIDFEVPIDKHKIDKVIIDLLDRYSVADITISEPDIDEIIGAIYKSK